MPLRPSLSEAANTNCPASFIRPDKADIVFTVEPSSAWPIAMTPFSDGSMPSKKPSFPASGVARAMIVPDALIDGPKVTLVENDENGPAVVVTVVSPPPLPVKSPAPPASSPTVNATTPPALIDGR
jgi:hypothetical protein